MKKVLVTLAVAFGALALTACQSTSNSPTPSSSSSSSVACGGAGTQYINGQWYNTSTGQIINCANGGYGYTPGGGQYGGGYYGMSGCSYWNQMYSYLGYYYVPMQDVASGQLVCVNVSQQTYQTMISYGWNQSTPIYSCPYADPYACYGYMQGYGYNQYGYGGGGTCLGASFGDFAIGGCW